MRDVPCLKCGLRSCLVEELTKRLQEYRDKTGVPDLKMRTLTREITDAQNNCEAFARARKKPS